MLNDLAVVFVFAVDHAAEAELSTGVKVQSLAYLSLTVVTLQSILMGMFEFGFPSFSGEGTRTHVFSKGNADFNKGETRSQPKTISGSTPS